MEERRKIQRGRTLKAGTISFNRAGGIDCRVRNMSPVGACLEVSSQVGIPNDFVLVVGYDKFKQTCHVVWRSDTRWAWNFAPLSAPKATVNRDQAAATARFRHDLIRPSNPLIDNQFPGFLQRGKRVCHRRNSCSLFAQVRALPAFFKAPAIVRPTT